MPQDTSTILLVDDEDSIQTLLTYPLEREGYRVVQARAGDEALRRFAEEEIDLVVLDLMLPRVDGLEVCRRLRAESTVPIIMLTARDDELDKVLGLELGADDYVTKPFSPRELVARVKAILRRTEGTSDRDRPTVIEIGDAIVIDTGRREVTLRGDAVALATREFELLRHLGEHRGLALSRRQLLDGVWGHDWVGDDRTVDVHVRQLRKKLGDSLPLTTVWGVGYRLD